MASFGNFTPSVGGINTLARPLGKDNFREQEYGGSGLMASECEQSFHTSKDLEALVAGTKSFGLPSEKSANFSQQSVSVGFAKIDDAKTMS